MSWLTNLFTMATDIGIDLGTATTLVYVKGKGIVLREPSVVAVDTDTKRVLAIGEEARRMVGRTPANITAVRPLREGVIADYDMTEAMLRYFVARVCGRRMFLRPRIMICVPSGVTTVEQRAVLEAARQAGARKANVIEEPLAAALGAGLDISQPTGYMVVDIGGGTTDIAVLSLGGVVISDSLRIAGDKFDEAIIRYIRREHDLLIGERSAEDVKIKIGSCFAEGRNEEAEVRGRDLVTGLPRTVKVTSEQARQALEEPVAAIIETVKRMLESTPPELAADIVDRGLVLTGGGAMLEGLDRRIARETGVPCHLAADPLSCVAMGTGLALEHYETYQDHIVVIGSRASL